MVLSERSLWFSQRYASARWHLAAATTPVDPIIYSVMLLHKMKLRPCLDKSSKAMIFLATFLTFVSFQVRVTAGGEWVCHPQAHPVEEQAQGGDSVGRRNTQSHTHTSIRPNNKGFRTSK